MTPEDVSLVQQSFAKVIPNADAVAQSFYANLFAADPSLRAMFKGDLNEQRRKLMLTLGTVIQNLHQLDQVIYAITSLGVRHVQYGVKDRHYSLVGKALLEALGEHVPAFDADCRAAWGRAYALLSRTMMDAAAASQAGKAA